MLVILSINSPQYNINMISCNKRAIQYYTHDPNNIQEVKDVYPNISDKEIYILLKEQWNNLFPEEREPYKKLVQEQYITITPISGNQNNKSFIDFEEQIGRNSHILDGDEFWDDTKYNTFIGDYFAFYLVGSKMRREGKFIIHKVEDIKSPSWTKNVGRGDRNVLQLSKPICEISIDDWIYLGGTLAKQSTYRTKGIKNRNFIEHLKNYIMLNNCSGVYV